MINKILGQSSFWIVNKAIARHLKCNDSALLLSELIDKYEFFKSNNELNNDYFYFTSEAIENSINLTYHNQKRCIKKLVDFGFLEVKLSGIPAKQHFKIIENKILKFLNTCIENNLKQDSKNFELSNKYNNNNYIINNKNKKEVLDLEIKKPKKTNSNFLLPELQKMIEIFNSYFETNHKNEEAVLTNYAHWRNVYEAAEIEEAIFNATKDTYWKNILTPIILFRQKNTQGEKVDYIGQFLNKKPESKTGVEKQKQDLVNAAMGAMAMQEQKLKEKYNIN